MFDNKLNEKTLADLCHISFLQLCLCFHNYLLPTLFKSILLIISNSHAILSGQCLYWTTPTKSIQLCLPLDLRHIPAFFNISAYPFSCLILFNSLYVGDSISCASGLAALFVWPSYLNLLCIRSNSCKEEETC